MLHLAPTRRPRRAGEWTEAKAVTFIVTLAASRSVTLAAARAGMSRKPAYALKRRDARFAAAWLAALAASAPTRHEGAKVDEVYDHGVRRAQVNKSAPRGNGTLAGKRRGDSFESLWESIIDSVVGSALVRQPRLP